MVVGKGSHVGTHVCDRTGTPCVLEEMGHLELMSPRPPGHGPWGGRPQCLPPVLCSSVRLFGGESGPEEKLSKWETEAQPGAPPARSRRLSSSTFCGR